MSGNSTGAADASGPGRRRSTRRRGEEAESISIVSDDSLPGPGASQEVIEHVIQLHANVCADDRTRCFQCACGRAVAVGCPSCNSVIFIACAPDKPQCRHARMVLWAVQHPETRFRLGNSWEDVACDVIPS